MKIETLEQLLAAKRKYRDFQKWADAAGVKAQTIWKWERGTATPSVRLLKRVCAAAEAGIAALED
jgi:transcriptional regulator with XRE-family HTH domain